MNKFTNTGPLYNLIKWSFILLILVDTNRIIADESNSVLRIGGHTDVLFDARRQDAEISFNLMFSEFLQEVGETSTVTIYS
ncbi:MAG: hypothetical protein AB2777_22710, partial [Candidatus Thiodiazotropha endolucinida]